MLIVKKIYDKNNSHEIILYIKLHHGHLEKSIINVF
jgi:hypothetical protein